MEVQQIIPFLLKMFPTIKETQATDAVRNSAYRNGKAAGEVVDSSYVNTEAEKSENKGNQRPVFVPLPWDTQLFSESKFFGLVSENEGSVEKRKETYRGGILIELSAPQLGRLWVFVLQNQRMLFIKWFTGSQGARLLIEEELPLLNSMLNELGFHHIEQSFQLVGTGRWPDFSSIGEGESLLNIQV